MTNIYNILYSVNNDTYKNGVISFTQKYHYYKIIIYNDNNQVIFNEYIFNDNLTILFNYDRLECTINDIVIKFNYCYINEWISFTNEISNLINIKNEIRQFYNYNFFL